ncbi:MAG: hypothetical protein IPK85_01040 [Gemmatimonadetes bacterium]|nr:hypothetical protein [Gemmatimonadota bacterium]
MVHKDPPHRGRDDGEKVHAIVPLDVGAGQPQESFVNHGGRLERVADPLALHLPRCKGTQFLVHHGHEAIEVHLIADLPGGSTRVTVFPSDINRSRRRWASSNVARYALGRASAPGAGQRGRVNMSLHRATSAA